MLKYLSQDKELGKEDSNVYLQYIVNTSIILCIGLGDTIMKTPHTKAYTYIVRNLVKDEVLESTYIVALLPTAPSIQTYIERLNSMNKGEYRLVEEMPVHKAIYKRGIAGGMIYTDWRLLEGMLFHSVEIERKVLVN